MSIRDMPNELNSTGENRIYNGVQMLIKILRRIIEGICRQLLHMSIMIKASVVNRVIFRSLSWML